jgi:O-antigen/teichoic acid export membrane protein
MRRRFIMSAFAVAFLLVLALIFPPFPRTWERYASYALSVIVLVPVLRWWFEREIRIGQAKLRARDEGSRRARR